MRLFDWLKPKKTLAPLVGAPAVRRQKTYSGQSGYVYQYLYEGYRPAGRDAGSGTEYVFDVSADRRTSFSVSVFISDSALRRWEQAHGRPLQGNERYAVAKMALFRAFDERETPERMREEVRVDEQAVDEFLTTLDIT